MCVIGLWTCCSRGDCCVSPCAVSCISVLVEWPVQTPRHPNAFRTGQFFVISGHVLTQEIRSPCLRKASCDLTVALNDPLMWNPLCHLTDETFHTRILSVLTCETHSLPGTLFVCSDARNPFLTRNLVCLFWHVKPIPYQKSCLSVLTHETNSLTENCFDAWNPSLTRSLFVCSDSPSNPPAPGMWKGCLSNGKSGYFNPTNTVPYVEPKTSPISLPKTSLSRKGKCQTVISPSTFLWIPSFFTPFFLHSLC